MKKLILLAFFIGLLKIGFGQAGMCQASDPFCTSNTYVFPGGVNTGQGQPGPNYGCLGSTPNPAWYHMRINQPGDLQITMFSIPSEDIDFICWGPFIDPVAACELGLTGPNIVDCSYSTASTEICDIPNSQVDEYYILLITNFSNDPCDITFELTAGTGQTDCSIVPAQVSNNGPLCVGDTLELYATSEPGATYEWTGPLGFTSTDQNPIIPNVTLGHAGDYQVVITVDGLVSDPAITTVVVNPNPLPAFTFTPDTLLCVDENILFSATSTETIASWTWDFGNGDFGSGQNVNYAYPADGNFTVDLLVTTTENCQANVNQAIVIHPLPVASLPRVPLFVLTNN